MICHRQKIFSIYWDLYCVNKNITRPGVHLCPAHRLQSRPLVRTSSSRVEYQHFTKMGEGRTYSAENQNKNLAMNVKFKWLNTAIHVCYVRVFDKYQKIFSFSCVVDKIYHMVNRLRSSLSSCHHVIMSSYHHIIMSSCHHFIISSCHHQYLSELWKLLTWVIFCPPTILLKFLFVGLSTPQVQSITEEICCWNIQNENVI